MSDLPRLPRPGQDPPAARHLRLVSDKPTPPRKKKYRKTPVFSPEESARLRAALRTARTMFGTWACLADALYIAKNQIIGAASGRFAVSGNVAVRLARALGKPLESLCRAPRAADACPTCGRST